MCLFNYLVVHTTQEIFNCYVLKVNFFCPNSGLEKAKLDSAQNIKNPEVRTRSRIKGQALQLAKAESPSVVVKFRMITD